MNFGEKNMTLGCGDTLFEDIQSRLSKWREERGLSIENQQINFEVNYSKRLVKFFEAKRDNNEYGMIGAICDMLIVAINAGSHFGNVQSDFTTEDNLVMPLVYRGMPIIGLLVELKSREYDPYLCLLEAVKDLKSHTGAWDKERCKWTEDMGAYTEEEAWEKARAIDSKCVMVYKPNELLGAPEDTWGFEGDSGAIEIRKWYKADYERCKIK